VRSICIDGRRVSLGAGSPRTIFFCVSSWEPNDLGNVELRSGSVSTVNKAVGGVDRELDAGSILLGRPSCSSDAFACSTSGPTIVGTFKASPFSTVGVIISVGASSVVSLSSFCLVAAVPSERSAAFDFEMVGPNMERLPDAVVFSARDRFESTRERIVEVLATRDLAFAKVDFVGAANVEVDVLLGAGDVLRVRMNELEGDFVGTFLSSSARFAWSAGVETFLAKVDAVGFADGIGGTLSRGVKGERVMTLGEVDVFCC
jgi:hypothetical protein